MKKLYIINPHTLKEIKALDIRSGIDRRQAPVYLPRGFVQMPPSRLARA